MAAFFCERVLREQDGALSFIRIINTVSLPDFGPGKAVPVRLTLVLLLKSGGFEGTAAAIIRPRGPVAFVPSETASAPFTFKANEPEAFHALLIPMESWPTFAGVYEFDVVVNAQTLTTVEARVATFQPGTLPGGVPLPPRPK